MVKLQPEQTLYDAIGVTREATASEIRKAYHKLALQLHPDKNKDDEEAKERFQTLQKIYAVLSDPDKRKTYDRTGSLQDSEGLSSGQFDSLYAFYRDLYKPVTEDDIDTFSAQHRGSAEEEAEVLQYYTRFQGDMNTVFQWVVLSDPKKDSHRFMDLVDTAINAGEAKRYKQYTIWAKKVSATPRPADPLAPPKKKKNAKKAAGKSSELALVDQIRNKGASGFSSLIDQIAGKYGAGSIAVPDELSEEEFQAARRRMEERAAGRSAAGGSKRSNDKAAIGKRKKAKK